jgi:hypothetical protein
MQRPRFYLHANFDFKRVCNTRVVHVDFIVSILIRLFEKYEKIFCNRFETGILFGSTQNFE